MLLKEKRLLLGLFYLFSIPFIYPQSQLKGTVLDDTQMPIPYADILLKDSSGNWTSDRAISDKSGEFKLITEESGAHKISIISVGFEQFNSNTFNIKRNQNVALGKLILKESSFQLQDVNVTAKRIPYKREIDRTVIDLEDDATTSGSTLLDILERTPGVIVDRQNQSIAMLGKSGVRVMINGKMNYMPSEALLEFLNGMNAENAKAIELITTPPAQYDAEGNAGYINIKLKKKIGDGYNANFNSSIGFGDQKTNKNIGVNYNLMKKKSTILINYTLSQNNLPWNGEVNRRLEYGDQLIENQILGFRQNDRVIQNVRVAYDYRLNSKLNLGANISGYTNIYDGEEHKTVGFLNRASGPDIYDLDESNNWRNFQSAFFIEFNPNENSKLSFNVDFLNFTNNQTPQYDIELNENSSPEILLINSDKKTPFDIMAYALEYETTLDNELNFSTGLKWVVNDFRNTNEIKRNQIIDPIFSNDSELEENIAAAYIQVKHKINDKIGFQAGLRYEHTKTFVQGVKDKEVFVDRNYGNFFPTLFLSYKINDFNNINLAASQRINRPELNSLAPFIYFLDIDQVFQGNVALQPAFTDNLQFDYRFKSFNLSIQYSEEKDVISRFQPNINPESYLITLTPKNIDMQKTLSAIFSYSLNPITAWDLRFFSTFINTHLLDKRELEEDFSIRNTSIRFNLNNNISLGNGYSFQLWGYFNSKEVSGVNISLPNGALNIGIQKVSKNFTFTLNGTNIMDSQKWRFESKNDKIGYFQTFNVDFVPPQIKFSVSMRLGDQKLKVKTIEKSEASERINVN